MNPRKWGWGAERVHENDLCIGAPRGRAGARFENPMAISASQKLVSRTAEGIAAAADPHACAGLFRAAIAEFGFTTFACGQIDLVVRSRNVFYIVDWPESWLKFYVASSLIERDPVVDAIIRRRAPVSWSEMQVDHRLAGLGTNALRESNRHGWTEGFAVPIPNGDRHCGLVSLAGARGPIGAEEKSLLAILSLCLYVRARSLAPVHGFAVPPSGLTAREIECLQLIAVGNGFEAAGAKMGISPDTAREHFDNAKYKLKISSRGHTIAIAVTLGIVAT